MVKPEMVSFLAGGMAGASVDLVFFPLDTLKTRMQVSWLVEEEGEEEED